jgi:NAD(P)-dependent dehydrogenase (short-subunit alcohol dehydrogenase family)
MTRVLITGASDGLGRALAYALAERGYELIVHGRDAHCLHPASLMPTTMVHQAGTGHIDTLERGLQATLRLVVDPALEGVTGRYFDREHEARALDQAYDVDFRKRLRELTESLASAQG